MREAFGQLSPSGKDSDTSAWCMSQNSIVDTAHGINATLSVAAFRHLSAVPSPQQTRAASPGPMPLGSSAQTTLWKDLNPSAMHPVLCLGSSTQDTDTIQTPLPCGT